MLIFTWLDLKNQNYIYIIERHVFAWEKITHEKLERARGTSNILMKINDNEEMNHLAKTVVQATIDNKKSAFQGKGIKRVVIPPYGQGAFLNEIGRAHV